MNTETDRDEYIAHLGRLNADEHLFVISGASFPSACFTYSEDRQVKQTTGVNGI
jgi:hypothetical protein